MEDFLLISALSAFGLGGLLFLTKILESKVKFEHLGLVASLLVVSFPFEYVPSFDIAGATLKLGYIVFGVGLYLLLILFLKRDVKLLQTRVSPLAKYLFWFLVFSIPSLFFVEDFKRFLLVTIATLLTFGIAVFVATFAKDVFKQVRNLVLVLTFTNIFGVYQFVGDFIGLPTSLTFLKDRYTGEVFGFARIQSTAIEPLYYAGMLFLPIIALYFGVVSKNYILKLPEFLVNKIKNKIEGFDIFGFKIVKVEDDILNYWFNFVLLLFHIFIFVLTLSKGAYLALAIALLIGTLMVIKKYNFTFILKKFYTLGLFAGVSLFFLSFKFEAIQNYFTEIIGNFSATINNQSASSVERSRFLGALFYLFPYFAVTGVGAGQYGVYTEFLLKSLNPGGDGYLIANNVYLEVLFEYGILSFLVFILLLSWIFFTNTSFLMKNLKKSLPVLLEKEFYLRLVLVLSLFTYCIQWLSFSPIYITPIFIIMALLVNLESRGLDVK